MFEQYSPALDGMEGRRQSVRSGAVFSNSSDEIKICIIIKHKHIELRSSAVRSSLVEMVKVRVTGCMAGV